MIPVLLLAQNLAVSWMTAFMAPFEATYGRIESELERDCPEQPIRAANSSEIGGASRAERHGIASWLRRHLRWPQ